MCSKAPKPDPLIGRAAASNAELAKEMAGVAREQLSWEKDRAAKQDPLIDKVVNQQIASGEANAERAESQWQIYRDLFAPVEERMVKDANEFDSDERKDRMASEAGADVSRSYEGALDSNQRQMERMGVNPNSGRFAALTNETNLAKAKDTAGAMNQARRGTEMQGIALRTGAAQFGRNMPNTGIAADSMALNAGTHGVNSMAAGSQIRSQNMAGAQNWFGGAGSLYGSSGNMMLGQYQGDLQRYQAKNDAMGGWLNAAATLGGAALLRKPGAAKGGMIRGNTVYRLKPGRSGGLSSLKRKGYAEGGMINGPGTGTSDSIPATIEGKEPIQVSNGEAVLNTGAVQITGEDFVHRINLIGQALNENPGGLAMLNQNKGDQ